MTPFHNEGLYRLTIYLFYLSTVSSIYYLSTKYFIYLSILTIYILSILSTLSSYYLLSNLSIFLSMDFQSLKSTLVTRVGRR